MCNSPPCEPRSIVSVICAAQNFAERNKLYRAQLGVLEGCPLVLLGRVWEGLAPSKEMVVGLLQKLRYIFNFAYM